MQGLLEQNPAPAGERNEKPQQRLLRGYLHKTSNGLCGIKGFASLIARGEASTENAARWAEKIIREVERMEDIFRSVGDLGCTGARPVEGDLAATLETAATRARQRHPALRIELGFVPEAALLLPAADLGLILDELLANAAEAGEQEGRPVTVHLDGMVGLGDRIALIVQDDGPGIARELLPTAADPFVSTRDGHHGIGLARVETLLDMYGLTWNLASEPGRGVVVTMEVGAAEAWEDAPADWNEASERKAGNG